MALTTRITDDLKTAMKAGRGLEVETLRTIRAAILEFEKSGSHAAMGEADELAILNAAAKKRREAIETYRKAGREDLAVREEEELQVILRYLPAQLGELELEQLVRDVITELGAVGMTDFGRVMGAVMQKAKGRADGAVIQRIVRAALA